MLFPSAGLIGVQVDSPLLTLCTVCLNGVLWCVTGVLTGACGDKTLRLRPTLIVENKHVDIFLDLLDQVLQENK